MRITERELRKIVRQEILREGALPPGFEPIGTTPDGMGVFVGVDQAASAGRVFAGLYVSEAGSEGVKGTSHTRFPGLAYVQAAGEGVGTDPATARVDLARKARTSLMQLTRRGDLRPSEARLGSILQVAIDSLGKR